MHRPFRPHLVIPIAVIVLIAAAAAGSLLAQPADAHGSTQKPASRYYTCRFENPDNPQCAAAWAANSQSLYDWMEVNIGDAAGRHQELIPDGKLCSANRDKYAAFDVPGAWPVTNLQANGSGMFDVTYQNTAPHATEYYRFYITRDGFDARTDSLGWGDLELVFDSGALKPATEQNFQIPLPNRATPAILYVVWQRSDSPEAFYSCSDVTVNGGSGTPTPSTSPSTTPPSTVPPSTVPVPTTVAPPTTAAPGTSEPGSGAGTSTTMSPGMPGGGGGMEMPDGESLVSVVAGVEAEKLVTATWESGQCFVVKVTNTNDRATDWEVHLDPGGRVDALWNAGGTTMGEGDDAHLMLIGDSWNANLGAGRWTSFGLCVGY